MYLVELILLCIILEFHPGTQDGKETQEKYYYTYEGGWDKKLSDIQWPAINARGGACIGLLDYYGGGEET